jgi:cytidine deaminase
MTPDQLPTLIAAALQASQRAYAPYSSFPVGAALLTSTGEIISGCNVENVSYGLTICAERVAACTAIAAGHKNFLALAVATPGGCTPCGACRQFLAEFSPELPIWLVDSDQPERVLETNLKELLPGRFLFPK